MSIIAKQSTARTVMVGPILDEDGVAVTDAAVGDLKLSKNGAAPAALNGSATLTHRNTGHYSLALTTSDLDTVGSGQVVIDDTTNAMPPLSITVIEEAVYDALYGASATGLLPANLTQIAGNGTNATNLGTAASNYSATRGLAGTALPAAAADAAGGLVISDAGGLDIDAKLANAVPTTSQINNAIEGGQIGADVTSILADTNELQTNQGDWATATGFSTHSAADVWTSGTRTLTAFTFAVDVASDGMDNVTLPANIITGVSIAASAFDGKGDWNTTTPPAASAIADAVWDEAQAGHTTAGTFGKYLDSEVSGAGGSSSNPTTLQSTTIATLASQTSFTLTAGSADDDAYNGRLIVFTDQATGTQKAVGVISDYTGSTKTVTLEAAPDFTIATGDSVDILAMGDTRAASIDQILARTGQGVSGNTQRQAESNYNFADPIVRGTDYNSTAGNAWTWTLTGFPASPWQSGTTGTLEFKQGCETSWTEVGTIAIAHDGDETLTPSASFTDTESSSLTADVSTCYRLTLTNGTNTWVTTGSWSVTD